MKKNDAKILLEISINLTIMFSSSLSNISLFGFYRPYNDGSMITAQVLSFIALILSWNIASALVGK